MASGSSGRLGFDFGSDDILCSYDDMVNPNGINGKLSDPITGTNSVKVIDYKDWQIALSRRFRSMKLRLVLRSHGVTNLITFLRSHVKMAKHFQGFIGMDNRFEIVVPRTFVMVCFCLKPTAIFQQKTFGNDYIEAQTNDINVKLLESVNASGKICMTHAVVGEVYMIRFAVGETLTEESHVTGAWKVVQEHTDAILDPQDGDIC